MATKNYLHGPYFNYVQSLAGSFPRLQLLVDFMSSELKIKGYHSSEDVTRRLKKVDVNVIDLVSSTPSPRKFDNIETLSAYLDTPQDSDSTRIILVESLSADVIEVLGSKYKLDPRFFENYVRDIQVFLVDRWEGDKMDRVQTPLSEVLQQNFIHLKYSRPYVFKGWEAAWNARASWNVPRMGSQAQSLFLQEFPAMYGPIDSADGSTTYSKVIMLCDVLLDTALPEGIHLRNNDPLPTFDPKKEYSSVPSTMERNHTSIRTNLENALLRSNAFTSDDIRTLLMHTILKTALGFHATAIHELSLRKYRLDSRYSIRPKDSYKSMVERLHQRGGWMNLHGSTGKSMSQIRNVWVPSLPAGEMRNSVLLELEHLEEGHQRVNRRQAQILEFLRQEQEITFTRSVERLTIIAFLFLPFSTMATILSIDDTMRFGVFIALAIPVSVICIAFGIRGVSLAAIAARTKRLGSSVGSWFSPHGANIVRSDVESKIEVTELLDLYSKVLEAKSRHDEKSMSVLISEVESRPSLRQRGFERPKSP